MTVVNQPRTARDRFDHALAILRRTRRFFLPAFLVVLFGSGASVAYALMHRPIFRSETLLRSRTEIHPDDLVLSRPRLEQIIKDSRLYSEIIEERGLVDAVDEMRKHITLRVQDGDTVGLSYEGEDPARVQLVTTRLADALIEGSAPTVPAPVEPVRESADRDRDRDRDRENDKDRGDRERSEKELKDREQARTQFLVKHPEFVREISQPGSLIRAAAAATVAPAPVAPKVDATLASLEREAARLRERLASPAAHAHKDEVQPDPALAAAAREADAEVSQAQRDLIEKQGQFTEEHPDVRAAEARLTAAQTKQRHTSDALAASVTAQQQRNLAQEEDQGYIDRGALENLLKRINEEIVQYKRRKIGAPAAPRPTVVVASVVALEADWARLNRDVTDARERLQSLPDKSDKADKSDKSDKADKSDTDKADKSDKADNADKVAKPALAANSAPAASPGAQLMVVDPAFVPTHAARLGRRQIVIAGTALALALGLLLALSLALLDDRLYDRFDVESLGTLPLLSVVPHPKREKQVKLG